VVVAVVANLVVRAILGLFMDFDPAFLPLTFGPIAIFTALGVGLGALVFALIARRSARPNRTWTIVAVVALIVSILPNLASMANPSALPFPGGTAASFGALIVFHIVAGLVAILLLPALAKTK
jgi:thiol:disulfide interchange protein